MFFVDPLKSGDTETVWRGILVFLYFSELFQLYVLYIMHSHKLTQSKVCNGRVSDVFSRRVWGQNFQKLIFLIFSITPHFSLQITTYNHILSYTHLPSPISRVMYYLAQLSIWFLCYINPEVKLMKKSVKP